MNLNPINLNVGETLTSLRVIRSTNTVVALVVLLLVALAVAVLFSAVPLALKCVVLGVLVLLFVWVWNLYWRKAKTEPLAATEEYLIASLPFLYGQKFGQEEERTTRAEELKAPKSEPRLITSEPPTEIEEGKEGKT